MTTADTVGMVLAFFLTILVLLYVLDDNTLFRLAIHIFIGVAAGYAGAIAVKDALIPRLVELRGFGFLVAIVLILLILLKISPRTAPFGNPASGFLVGAGAAIAVGGAIQGTLLPQVSSAGNFFNQGLIQGSFALIGTIATLAHFHFSAIRVTNQIPQRNPMMRVVSAIGQGYIAVTFGVIFAGVYSAALTALIERAKFIVDFIAMLLGASQ